ncbi:MAG: bis(5'-nucleosyl)-tetraphosphatase (symmetrical) YqeK [Adlercreutzia equolifaciens]
MSCPGGRATLGVTYAVDTLRELREELPGWSSVFIVGADAALTLPRWRKSAELAHLAAFAAATRPGFELGEQALRDLREHGFDVRPLRRAGPRHFLECAARVCTRGAPSAIWCLRPCERSLKGNRCTEGRPMVDGWRSDAFYEARRDELEKRVGPRRFSYSLGVSETAEKLARVYGADETAARVAGLLHDWDKGYDDPGILARADELGMELDAELVAMPRVLHGLTAAVALGRAFPELSPEVLTAVERHTLGDAGMSDLDMIVYIADALEPGRRARSWKSCARR